MKNRDILELHELSDQIRRLLNLNESVFNSELNNLCKDRYYCDMLRESLQRITEISDDMMEVLKNGTTE